MDDILAASAGYTYAFEPSGTYTYVSPAGAHVFGLEPDAIVGRTWGELGLPAEITEPFDAQRERVLVTRRPLSGELRCATPQGLRIWESTLNPIFAADGTLEVVIARARDVTDLRVTEGASEHFHPPDSPLTESAADGFVWYADITEGGDRLHWDLRMDEAAAQRVFPLDREPGQSYASAWYWSRLDEDRLRTDAHGLGEIRAGRSYSQEFRCRGRDGQVRWCSEDVRLETVQPGRWRAVGVCQDITHRKKDPALDPRDERVRQEQVARAEAERRFQEAQEEGRRKDDFLAMLAHELRNPLAPMLNAVQVMRLRSQPDPPLERAREVVERQVRHMARLLDDLLDVSRITRGLIELRKEPVDLAAVVADALQTSRPFMEAQRHEVLVSLPPESLSLEADATRLEQVITNLLNNAAKYTEAEGRIWITLTREDEEAVLRIRDTGVGLSPELLPRVFDLFTQADRSLDRSQGGLGVGLTLVRRLVEMHGGHVTADSPGPGQGSEFVVRLPLLERRTEGTEFNKDVQDIQDGEGSRVKGQGSGGDEPSVPAPMDPRPSPLDPSPSCISCTSLLNSVPPVPRSTIARRVLIVEDHADAAQTLAELLELWGHEVRVALDGPMALEAAAEFEPEVTLVDIGLPGMDGYEVARRLRRHPHLSHALLVALTGYGQAEDRSRSREAGFQVHLTKPVDLGELARLIAGKRAEAG